MAVVALDFLANMNFGDDAALRDFALAHRLAHNDFASAISSLYGASTPNFDVADESAHAVWAMDMVKPDEVPAQGREALKSWLLFHAQLHEAEYNAIGLGPAFDFSTVDFSKADQFYNWMQQHQQAHDITAGALGIT